MNIQQAYVQAMKDSILKAWAQQKKMQLTVDVTAQEIEEITNEMELMTGEELAKYEAMLNAAKESNRQASIKLEKIVSRHKELRSKYDEFVSNS